MSALCNQNHECFQHDETRAIVASRELNFELLEKVFTLFEENNLIIFKFKLTW